MTIKQLLILGGVLLTSITATAEIIDGVRQRPNVTKTETLQVNVVVDETTTSSPVYYMFNTKARMFFVGANDWNTRGSIGTKGYKMKFVLSEDAPEGSYEFVDSVETQSSWKNVWATDDGGAVWVDRVDQTYYFWEFTESNGKYRISNNNLAEMLPGLEGKYMGWNGSEADTRLYFLDPAAEGVGVDWVFVTEETYKVWLAEWESMKAQFEAAAELLTYLKSAKEQNINVDAEQTVYNNEAATVEELNAATLAVQKKISDALGGNATVDNPADMTGSLMNPNFDGHSSEGWKGDKPGFGNDPHPAAEVAEFYGKDKYDLYQELNGMPAGVYKLTANAYNRGAWEGHAEKKDYVVHLYAQADNDTVTSTVMNAWDAMNTEPLAGETSFGTTATHEEQTHDAVSYYIPSDPSAARVAFERGLYLNDLYFMVEEGSVRVGIRKDKKIYDWDWECMDNFNLTYFGKAADAYQFYFSKAAPEKKEYSVAEASKQYLDAYDAAYALTATNKAEAKAAIKAINDANDSIAKNIKLWADFRTAYEEANLMRAKSDYAKLISTLVLADFLETGEVDDIELPVIPQDLVGEENREGDLDLSNAEIQAIIDQIHALMEAVIKEFKSALKPGADVTEFIKNPSFEEKEGTDEKKPAGWTVVSKGGGNVSRTGTADSHVFEAWHSTNFDVYQEINDLPLGVYELSVKGYVRYLDGGDDKQNNPAINAKNDQPTDVPIYIYMNDSKASLPSWFASPMPMTFYDAVEGATYLYEDGDHAYPDNATAAVAAFGADCYKQTTKLLVSESGSVTRLGVKGNPSKAEFWPLFDDFHLTYLGYAIDVVKPLLEEKIAEAGTYASEMTTKDAKTALETALAEANTAVSGEDGLAMFKATSKLDKAINNLKEGHELCVDFMNFVNEFMSYADGSSSSLSSQAKELGGTVLGLLDANALDKEEIADYKLQIREMRLKMELPENYTQDSAEGVDVTAFIQTPSFEKYVEGVRKNSIDGWQGTSGYNFGNDDTQKGAFALEFYEKKFDMYQDLAGIGEVKLPKGYYTLQVNAFERVNKNSPAFLYATAGKETLGIVELADHAKGYDAAAGETAPGNMVESVALFEAGRYLNEVKFRFEGDTLRIGIKHTESNGADWVIMDNFKLLFHGQDNTGVETVVNLAKVMSVQYFTLDGRQVNAARKGLVIRKTIMDNGTVIVRKIQK